jgi:phenylpyruvate tautomerase PptA (4-oxalocrotonate tautomerase family)
MPIIDIEVVGPSDTMLAEEVQNLADDLGDAFEAAPGDVWVRLHTLPANHYAENRAQAPAPVFVTVTASAAPEGDGLRQRITRITDTVAHWTHRPPGNVHVLFAPPARGRIAFGGRLVE